MALDAKRNPLSGASLAVVTIHSPTSRPLGRPAATSHEQIESAAFQLFLDKGFDATTLDDIASAVGVGRRTLFRYFDSKNDIPWGRFDESLSEFARILRESPADLPLRDAVGRAVVEFNTYPPESAEQHLTRMRLIFQTSTLQAHSTIKFEQWRRVIAEFVAERTGASPDALGPRTVGHVSLALSLSAYEQWLADPSQSLTGLLRNAMRELMTYTTP
jgi:mycofactocin system transcriptional regulator